MKTKKSYRKMTFLETRAVDLALSRIVELATSLKESGTEGERELRRLNGEVQYIRRTLKIKPEIFRGAVDK